MSQEQNYNNFNRDEFNHEEEESVVQTIEQTEQVDTVFRKLGNNLSIKEKVELTVTLHTENYFLGKTFEELQAVDKRIQPLKMVTTKHISLIKSTKALNKKLSWVMSRDNRDKPFAQQFISDLANNKFTSVIKAQHRARYIFKTENPEEYSAKQATNSTQEIDGVKQRVSGGKRVIF